MEPISVLIRTPGTKTDEALKIIALVRKDHPNAKISVEVAV